MLGKTAYTKETWDYEWTYTTGGVYPPGMTYLKIEDVGDGLTVNSPNLYLSDENGLGDSELLVVMNGINGNGNSPQFVIVVSNKKGFKAFFPNGNSISSNAKGSNSVITGVNPRDIKSVRLRFESGVASLYINDLLVQNGPGVENNNYLKRAGILSDQTNVYIISLKEIKFRRLR